MNLTNAIYAAFEKQRKSTSLHPSAIGGCPLKEVLRVQEYKETNPATSVEDAWFLERYGWYERPFVSAAREACIIVEPPPPYSQHKLEMGLFSGKLDLLTYEVDKGFTIVEIKSVNPGAKNKPGATFPMERHLPQAHTYYVMAKDMHPEWSPLKVEMYYIDRWYDGDIPAIQGPFDVTPTPQQAALIVAKMDVLTLQAKDEDGLPARPWDDPEDSDWNCLHWNPKRRKVVIGCPYFFHCWSDDDVPEGSQ